MMASHDHHHRPVENDIPVVLNQREGDEEEEVVGDDVAWGPDRLPH